MGNNLCSKAFSDIIDTKLKNEHKKASKDDRPLILNAACSKLTGEAVKEDEYIFQCTRRKETPEEKEYRDRSNPKIGLYRRKSLKVNKKNSVRIEYGKPGCLVNNDKLFNKKNEAIFKKQNRELFIETQQGGGGLVDQNYLYKINLLKHPWLNDSENLSRFIEKERDMTKCIQLDEEEKASEIQFEKQFIKEIFTGGKRKKRKTRRKRNKSNKKKKIQIKNKSKKIERNLKIKHEINK